MRLAVAAEKRLLHGDRKTDLRALADRELEVLATARREESGLRLRVLMRMVDRVRMGGAHSSRVRL